MAEKSGKKNGSGTTLDLMGDDEAVKPRPARKAAAPMPAAEPAPVETGGALFGGEDVDLAARHPADVPVVGYPAPSQIAQVSEAADPFAEEDPFEDSVMARMLADEPAPLASPLRAAREDFNVTAPAAAGPDLEAFADPVAVPEVEQVIEHLPVEDAPEPIMALELESAPETIKPKIAEPEIVEEVEILMPAVLAEAPEAAAETPTQAAPLPAKKATQGLTFSRRYTQPGRDVWATTEWELRTASIVGSDGTVVFEQKGVEIPKAWSQLATNVVVSKYFRGQIGTLEREYSVKQLIGRVADKILEWAKLGSYFATETDAATFHDELRYILLHQFAAFNSPVWFNLGWAGRRQAVSACYITEVDDSMESILDLYKTEGMLFKDGSGSGHNLSPLRSSKEPLSAGGRSSGPIAFMKGLDASAGSIKSGGSTRRAAKMVILNADHPDIQEFIDCKNDAELKAHALIDAGYSGAFNVSGGAYDTVPFQNANHSVRVTDEFMQAVESDGTWDTKFRTDGKTAETLRARDLLHSIAEGTWVCGDPGMQYDTTANDWHTCANTDRIHASNPCCFVGETLIETAQGQMPFASLYGQHEAGEALPLVFSFDRHNRQPVLRSIRKVWIAGHTQNLVEVKTEHGLIFRCTPEHRFLTQDGTYVEAQHLAPGTALRSLRCTAKDLPESKNALQATLADAADVLLAVTPLTLDAPVPVYDMEVEDTHNFAITDASSAGLLSIVVSNSEFFFLNSTACNLSSLNLMKFRDARSGAFDTESFEHAVKVMITAQEIVVGFAHYPTEKIEQRSHAFRPLGLGYANLGALLMAAGLPYDSDAGRAYAGAVTALMTGRAYHQSATVARDCGGPFSGFAENRAPMLRVMGKHRAAVDEINEKLIPTTLLDAARTAWDDALEEGQVSGYRNAQATVLAPTGTIGFLMDCDTTGIEPDIAIVKYKSLVGGGMMKIVNQTVPEALDRLGYDEAQAAGIIKFIDENDTIEGAPGLKSEHLPIFDCAFRPMNGTRSIHYRGHLKMMAAAQPFISGAISKTVNVPTDASPEDIAETYLEAWQLGIKAVAIYRDGSKRTQPLNTSSEKSMEAKAAAAEAIAPENVLSTVPAPPKAVRRRLPDERDGITHKFSIGGHEGYLTVGLYPDTRQPGEIFIRMSKEGSSISGLMDSFATAISLALQYGVPLSTLVDKFIHSRFEPSGFTGNKEIPMAKSVMDYIFRYLALRFLQKEDRHNVGLIADQEDTYAAPPKLAAPTHDSKSGTLSSGKNGNGTGHKSDNAHLAETNTATLADHEHEIYRAQSDAPPCPECGAITIRSGACYKCLSCGTSLGCS